MRCAVVGHVEWVDFALVPHVPEAGAIAQGEPVLSVPAGGGAVVARQIARLNGRCEFFTALGDDELGHRAVTELAELGLDVHAQHFGSTRRGWVHVDESGERTITVIGEKLRPRGPLPLDGYDLAFFVAGDAEALRSARAAKYLAATMRELPTLREGGVRVDLVVGSANDAGESWDGSIDAGVVAMTDGARGGSANGVRWDAVAPPGPIVDAYGAGDSTGAAMAFALARGAALEDALALAARAGAAVITGRGPYTAQIGS
ncbi:MAG TPA: PfkB family carbohydrate kinase [Gaiellaceae bacterium]|nr:PfkB family carbohydrate kinase [Gaiellaceae bacterium]